MEEADLGASEHRAVWAGEELLPEKRGHGSQTAVTKPCYPQGWKTLELDTVALPSVTRPTLQPDPYTDRPHHMLRPSAHST